jgi:DNA-binding LytR/AlgR family response regulator
MHKVEFDDIVMIEAQKDYIKITLKSSPKQVITRMSMKALEDELPSSRFIRIHKSYILAISSITAIRKSSLFVGTSEFPIGDSYRNAVIALVGKQDKFQ